MALKLGALRNATIPRKRGSDREEVTKTALSVVVDDEEDDVVEVVDEDD